MVLKMVVFCVGGDLQAEKKIKGAGGAVLLTA